MSKAMPIENFVGKLHETCLKLYLSRPEFNDESSEFSELFKCSCRVGKYSSIGQGYSKKIAKHNAAKKVLDLIENDDTPGSDEKSKNFSDNVVSMLAVYCVKNNVGERPLYSEKPKEDDLFVFECTLKGYTATGKGKNKKIAKERAADLVAHKFGVHEYYKNLGKTRERKESLKNPVTLLHELSQTKKLSISFTEKTIDSNRFIATCEMGGKTTLSSVCISKKIAKMEAAQMMLKVHSHPTDNYLTTPPLSEKGEAISEDEVSSDGDRKDIISSTGLKRPLKKEIKNESSSDDEEPISKRASISS